MIEPKVIYETKNFLAVDKPAGLVVHAAKINEKKQETWDMRQGGINQKSEISNLQSQEPTLVDWLLEHYPEIKTVGDDPILRPGIVHRLDKDTSGVMLVAKNQEYFEYLKSLFQKHEIKKTYYAVVVGVPKEKQGIIDAPIGIKNGTLKRSVRSKKMAKEAITEYRALRNFQFPISNFQTNEKFPISNQKFSLLIVHPKTGRTHQIRVHLASIGHPIVGDKLYGPKKKKIPHPSSLIPHPFFQRLMLHAAVIEFREKDGSKMKIEAEMPIEFKRE